MFVEKLYGSGKPAAGGPLGRPPGSYNEQHIMSNTRRVRLAALLILIAAFLAYRYERPVDVYTQNSVADKDLSEFRIVVGTKDAEPKDWHGKIDVSGAEVASLEGWRFSQKDTAGVDGSFAFRTKVGPLEDQLLPDRYYGATDWNDPKARRVIPEGLIVRLRGSDNARVSFESAAGQFSFNTAQAAYGARLPVLDGNGYVERLPHGRKLSEAGTADDYPALSMAPDGTEWTAWL